MAAQYVLEDMADIPVRVELASEFRYRKMPLNQKALVIVVSQSGETADTLAALRLAKEKGITTMAIVNVVGSSIAREADKVFYTLAGPEISVATTKAYSAQLAAMYCLAVQFARVRGKITDEHSTAIIFLNCRLSRRRYRRFWKTKSVFSGSRQSTPTLMMCSLLVVVSTMQSAWKVA